MKIEGTCGTCKRTFLLEQVGPDSDSQGRCPFCGARFARHYTTVLVDAVADAEEASERFVHALTRLQAMEKGFHMDIETLLRDVAEQIRQHEPQQRAG